MDGKITISVTTEQLKWLLEGMIILVFSGKHMGMKDLTKEEKATVQQLAERLDRLYEEVKW